MKENIFNKIMDATPAYEHLNLNALRANEMNEGLGLLGVKAIIETEPESAIEELLDALTKKLHTREDGTHDSEAATKGVLLENKIFDDIAQSKKTAIRAKNKEMLNVANLDNSHKVELAYVLLHFFGALRKNGVDDSVIERAVNSMFNNLKNVGVYGSKARQTKLDDGVLKKCVVKFASYDYEKKPYLLAYQRFALVRAFDLFHGVFMNCVRNLYPKKVDKLYRKLHNKRESILIDLTADEVIKQRKGD